MKKIITLFICILINTLILAQEWTVESFYVCDEMNYCSDIEILHNTELSINSNLIEIDQLVFYAVNIETNNYTNGDITITYTAFNKDGLECNLIYSKCKDEELFTIQYPNSYVVYHIKLIS